MTQVKKRRRIAQEDKPQAPVPWRMIEGRWMTKEGEIEILPPKEEEAPGVRGWTVVMGVRLVKGFRSLVPGEIHMVKGIPLLLDSRGEQRYPGKPAPLGALYRHISEVAWLVIKHDSLDVLIETVGMIDGTDALRAFEALAHKHPEAWTSYEAASLNAEGDEA